MSASLKSASIMARYTGAAATVTLNAGLGRAANVPLPDGGTRTGRGLQTFMGDEIRPFHRGGFVAARAAKSEVLPIGVAYEKGSGAQFFGETFIAHLSRMSAASKPTRVVLAVGTPFVADSPAAALAKRAEADVASLAAQARARLGD